ncbi:MAG: hypothetical protein QXT74_05390 [Candidatus Nezhaarchaeales archaeon]
MLIRLRRIVLPTALALLILAWLSQPSQASLIINRTIELHELYLTIYDEVRSLEPVHLEVAVQQALDNGSLMSIYVRQEGSWFEPVRKGSLNLQGSGFNVYSVEVGGRATIVHSYLLLDRGLNRALIVPLYPIVSECISECNVTIKCAEGVSDVVTQPTLELRQADGALAFTTSMREVPPMYLTWLNITYGLTEGVDRILCSKCTKHVYIEPDGSLKISERLTFTSADPERLIEVIKLKLPAEARVVSVRDDLAAYSLVPQVGPQQFGSYSISTLDRYLLLEVRPRFTIRRGENVTFTLTYSVQPSRPGPIEFPAASFHNIPIALLEVYVHPPPGGSIAYANLPVGDGAAGARLSWWPPPVPSVEVAYYAAPSILPWLSLAALAIPFAASTSYLLLWSKRGVRAKLPPSVLSLEPLVMKYESRLALVNKHIKILHDLAAGKLKMRSYERLARTLLAEQARLEAELKEEGERLRSSWPELREALDELKRLEGELAKMKGRLNQALNRARSGKVTRESFRREVQELETQLEELLRSFRLALRELSAKT